MRIISLCVLVFSLLCTIVFFAVSNWDRKPIVNPDDDEVGFVCVSGCKIKTKGVIQLWIELLNEDDPKWQEHYSRYSGNNVTSESQNTLNHELDHFNTWKAFLDFVRTANAYDGKKVSNCAELVGRLNATYERYKSITSAHSLKFDQPGWNQGGQYSRHPLETSTFKWE